MFTKLYETIKKYIKNEYKFLITLIIILTLLTIKLPYYIDMPGGVIDITNRITIDKKNNLSGTMNFAYVSETRATLPTYIMAKINKDWDIIDIKKIVLENETEEEAKLRDQLALKEAMSNALYAGFKESKEKFEIKNDKIYVTHIFEEADTNLKIGDQIITIDGIQINEKEDLKFINNYEEKQEVEIIVKNNNVEQKRKAKLINYEGKIIIGVGITETFDIETNHDIDIKYKKKESGPSGGMMTALTIYSYLTNTDLTNGKKIVGTGTIDKEGNVGPIGGVKYKLIGAVKNKADIFLVPNGDNYEEAIKIKKEKNYDIKIIGISTLKQAINELEKN